KKNLTEHFDNWVGTFTWSPDSKRIYFVSQTTGGQPIQSLAVDQSGTVDPSFISFVQPTNLGNDNKPGAGKHKTPFFVEDYNDDIALTRDGGTLVFTSMSLQAPNEIYKINLQKEVEEPLTHLNDHVLSQVAMSPLEPFAANGYVVIMINFHGSTGYGQKFIDAINGDWGGAPFEDLMKGLDYAEKAYPFIDKDRECALGASYGGYMANWILGHTDRFKCIVSHDGMFNTVSAWGTTEELWFNNWEFKGTPY